MVSREQYSTDVKAVEKRIFARATNWMVVGGAIIIVAQYVPLGEWVAAIGGLVGLIGAWKFFSIMARPQPRKEQGPDQLPR